MQEDQAWLGGCFAAHLLLKGSEESVCACIFKHLCRENGTSAGGQLQKQKRRGDLTSKWAKLNLVCYPFTVFRTTLSPGRQAQTGLIKTTEMSLSIGRHLLNMAKYYFRLKYEIAHSELLLSERPVAGWLPRMGLSSCLILTLP